jgi:hypothetical protein
MAAAYLEQTLPARVSHFHDARAFQVLTQQHHKRRRIRHQFARLALENMNTRKLRVRRGNQPAIMTGTAVGLERHRLRRGLYDGIDAGADQSLTELIGNRSQCQSIDIHGGIASFPATSAGLVV